jgi:hypothetical protein
MDPVATEFAQFTYRSLWYTNAKLDRLRVS